MRAVNLIPSDLRRATGSAGATGPAVYVLLAILGVAVVLVGAWAAVGRSVAQGEADLDRVRAEAAVAEQRAGELKAYAAFREMRIKRVQTVTSLSRSRFNWPFVLREVSRVLPDDVWLSGITGTVAPGVQLEDAVGSATGLLRSQLVAPALEIVGCATTQEELSRYLARLRSIQGVTRVTLAQSEKLDVPADRKDGASGSGGQESDCRQGNSKIPKFELITFFEASTATVSVGGSPAAAQPTADKEESK